MSIIPNKSSDHEETDTKVVAFIGNASIQPGNTVMVRSPHGDIGILVLFLLHQFENITLLIDNGAGKNRKIIDISSSFLCENKRKAVVGMHSFSENDYLSSLSRKGKKVVWNLTLQSEEFMETFSNLGLFISVTEEVTAYENLFVNFIVIKMIQVLIKLDSKVYRTCLYCHLVYQI